MKKIIIISLLLFILVLIGTTSFLLNLDKTINQSTPDIQTTSLVSISKALDIVFDTKIILILSLLITIFLYYKSSKKESFLFASIMIVSSLIIYLLKEIIARARPLNSLISSTDLSFPSGHTTTAVVFFGLLIYLAWKNKSRYINQITTISIILLAIISFSRIYLNAHWFSDVLASIFLGLFILFSGISIRKLF